MNAATPLPASSPTMGSRSEADLDAARLLLARMGIKPESLIAAGSSAAPAETTLLPSPRTEVPTFAAYVPVVSAAVTGFAYSDTCVDQDGSPPPILPVSG